MRVDAREQRQIDHAELADWAKEARLSLLVSGHTNCRVNYAASDRGANLGALTASSGSHDLKVVAGGVATYSSTDPGAASVNFSALDALGNGDFTVWFVAGPLAASGTTYKQVFGQSGSAGACWLTANADENYAVVNGQIVMGLLQTGVNRSSIKAASALDGAPHAWCVRKRGATGQWWRDGVPLTTTTSGTLTGAPTAAGDTVYMVGSSLDGSAAMPEGLVMLGAARTSLGDDLCAKLATRRGAWQVWRPRRIWVPVSAGGGTTVTVNTATETDTAQAVASGQRATIGLATETDAAIAIALTQRAALGLATETDTAQALASHQARAIGLATETDTAQTISSGTVAAIGLATETDTAQALAITQSRALGLASETDAAQPISATGAGTLGAALETDAALPIAAHQVQLLGTATETDSARPISRLDTVAVGLASESDAAQPIVVHQRATLGTAIESDTAQPITVVGGEPPAPPPPSSQPGYRGNPRTARDLDPLPPTGEDLAELVRDKWAAIERADAELRRRRGDAAAAPATPAPAPAPLAPSLAPTAAAVVAKAQADALLERLRADEEAVILLLAEIV